MPLIKLGIDNRMMIKEVEMNVKKYFLDLTRAFDLREDDFFQMKYSLDHN